MNPCPCGHYGIRLRSVPALCRWSRVTEKTSGPLLARIDIHVEVPRVPFEKLSSQCTGEPSAKVREQVEVARAKQGEGFKDISLQTNSDMGHGEIYHFCPIEEASTNLLKAATQQMQLSAWAYHRILKLARTIADLAGAADI